MRRTFTLLLSLLSGGCVTAQATTGSVSKERATECVAHCEALDMKLAAVVIIRSSAGCVCEPKDAQGRVSSGSAAAAAGALIAEEEAQRQQQEQQRASYSSGH
jgi:hypothetical protein